MKRRCGPKEKWWMRRRKAVGAMPVLRAKSALNEPRLWNPTSKQMWGHRRIGEDQAPRCLEPHPRQVLVRRHPEGGAEKAEEVEGRQRGLAGQRTQIERLRVAGVDGVAGAEQPAEAVVVDHVETAHI